FRIRRKNDVSGPARDSARRQRDRISNGLISATAPIKHPSQHGRVQVGIVINANFSLSVIQTVKTSCILSNSSMPGYGQRKNQRVQPRIIKSFSDITASRENDAPLVRGNCGELGGNGLALLLSHSPSEHDHISNFPLQLIRKNVEVFVSFCQ